jgi:hypothetical protein
MAIIRTSAPRPGWRTTTKMPTRFLTCERCGAACDENVTSEHDDWHSTLELSTLPQFSDFVTFEVAGAVSA